MMFYAERMGDQSKGEPYIAERGVFLSIEEFAPYRKAGWSGTREIDAAADAVLARPECTKDRCWSPVACEAFGYCRELNK